MISLQSVIILFVIHVVVMVSVPATASFSEDAGTVQVCATLTGMTAIPISITVSAIDGKVTQYRPDCSLL